MPSTCNKAGWFIKDPDDADDKALNFFKRFDYVKGFLFFLGALALAGIGEPSWAAGVAGVCVGLGAFFGIAGHGHAAVKRRNPTANG